MEVQAKPKHRENILTALSQVPIASTRQISLLFTNNGSPLRRASEQLIQMEKEKLIESFWHRRFKVWKATRKGLSLTMTSGFKRVEHIDHALEVAEIYFTLKPFQWLYEYQQEFDFAGKSRVFNPDCIAAYTTKEGKKKPICVEVQRTPLSVKQWNAKFQVFNEFFVEAYKKAEFQKWNEKKEVIPHFYVITSQGNVTGLDIPDRSLNIISNINELL